MRKKEIMAISIAIVKFGDNLNIQLGGWETKEEAQDCFEGSGSGEKVIAFNKYDPSYTPNFEILEAMAFSASEEFSIGRNLEGLLNYAFRLGRETERGLNPI